MLICPSSEVAQLRKRSKNVLKNQAEKRKIRMVSGLSSFVGFAQAL
jgi:hypothetical protein